MHTRLILVALTGLIAAGCGGKDDTADTSGTATGTATAAGTGTGSATGTGTGTGGDSFADLRDDILIPSCGASSCHGANNSSGLIIDGDTEASDLVDQPSTALAGAILVIPGDADGSYVVQKIDDAPGILGDPMPPPFGGLPDNQKSAIRDWIEAGANP